jgi:hypothetical protein
MFYRLLGMIVWKGWKFALRQKYGRTYVPKPLLAGAVLMLVGGFVLLVARHNGSED